MVHRSDESELNHKECSEFNMKYREDKSDIHCTDVYDSDDSDLNEKE